MLGGATRDSPCWYIGAGAAGRGSIGAASPGGVRRGRRSHSEPVPVFTAVQRVYVAARQRCQRTCDARRPTATAAAALGRSRTHDVV